MARGASERRTKANATGQKPPGAGSTWILRGLGKRSDYRKAPNDPTSSTCNQWPCCPVVL
ncbi:hypothetical protein PCL1606_50090 [Pseudomonas chlororaphis]|uniref:Uncharacterized protein n=1 Tax=Pseudomonas chlororaphis TaxID=587753 RepID=A0A0D5Y570_9PSED|nr:hypothetical protein PCL1606_50090 [Pseudomonas chlororaphis]